MREFLHLLGLHYAENVATFLTRIRVRVTRTSVYCCILLASQARLCMRNAARNH